MRRAAKGEMVSLLDRELLRRQNANRAYLLELKTEHLTLPYALEAGLYKTSETQPDIHGGWESPLCELRGHFLGHWLSAAATHYEATGDPVIKARADEVVEILARCQKENGGQWAASIPEKYLKWITIGKPVWAPQYTIHKTFMGLLDMYELAGNVMALEVAEHFADWFYDWSGQFSREKFQRILDVETGGMLEIWVILYRITGKTKYRELMDRYYRESLFDGLLAGKDVLTNMHANTTIPEVLGAAAWYEATGEEKMLEIVKKYWEAAVTKKGTYATGGQTCGEIWSPDGDMSARLGDKNQEHCTVYNMMRVAEFLFRQTGESAFMDYWEKNLYNGIMAQGYWKGSFTHGYQYHAEYPDEGLLTYFLPLRGGARKGWASKTNDFFCCHGSLVQANAAFNRCIYYEQAGQKPAEPSPDGLYICQYLDSDYAGIIAGAPMKIRQRINPLNGSEHLSSDSSGVQRINEVCPKVLHNPRKLVVDLEISSQAGKPIPVSVRIPSWSKSAKALVDDAPTAQQPVPGTFLTVEENWTGKILHLEFEKAITAEPLPGAENLVAFLDGPVVLAGLCGEERTLYLKDGQVPEDLLCPDNEREWGNWMNTWKTAGQERGIRFLPLYQVGYEPYSVYFPIEKK